VQASTEPGAAAQAQLVLLAVKAGDTEAAGRALQPHLRPGTLVLCLQNGVDNARRLRAVLQGLAVEVAAAAVYVAVAMPAPGHVQHHGRGELLLQRSPATAALAPALAAAGIPCELSDAVDAALWTKLCINCVYNALSALGALPYGVLVLQPQVPTLMAEVLAECRAVAAAEGVPLPADLDAAVAGIAQSMAGQLSSTAQDLLRGRPSEIDHLNGHVVLRAAAHGIPVPANRALWVAVRLAERARLQGPGHAAG
jgi:2-dehydropantoate 2-reductase